jgi:hypothetical protein
MVQVTMLQRLATIYEGKVMPVIRISEHVYEQLKKLAIPLVDNPSDVIERVLDFYEMANSDSDQSLDVEKRVSASHQKGPEKEHRNLFLGPGKRGNLRVTIEKAVSVAIFKQFLSGSEFEKLSVAIDGQKACYCWSTNRHRLSVFREMKTNDLVLLSKKGTGTFGYLGEIVYTLRNAELGNHLWPITPGLSFENICIFKDIEKVNIDKSRLVTELGFESNYEVPGLIRVRTSMVTRIVSRYHSLREFIFCLQSA